MTDLTTLYRIFLQSTGVTTDSRRCPAGSLFIALRGETFDGNAFAAQALKDGCACAVVDNPQYLPEGDPRYLLVDDCLKTLQQLARHHRRALGTPVIGITGTNGKTTTKELMAAVLSQQYQLHYTQGNLNNHIGVPLTLLGLRPEHQLAVIEMGASHPGDIRELVDAHDLKQVCYGSQAGLYVCGRMTGNSPYLALAWHTEGEAEEHPVQTHLIGEYNLPNALAAITVGRYFNVPAEQICQALESYVPHNNRSQLVRTADNTLIVDAYNANPTSMKAAIDNFHKMQAAHKMLILGDMRELGTDSPALHQEVVDQLETYGFEDVVLVGTAFAATRHHYPTYPDAPALIAELRTHRPTGKTILIKGSNGIHLNTVAEALK